MSLLAFLKYLLIQDDYQTQVDAYVTSHRPTDAGDVERLIREYEQQQTRNYF